MSGGHQRAPEGAVSWSLVHELEVLDYAGDFPHGNHSGQGLAMALG